MDKMDKPKKKIKYSRKPSIKNSFYQLYKKQINMIGKVVSVALGIGAVGGGLYAISKYTKLDIVLCIFLVGNGLVFLTAFGFVLYGLSQYIMFMFNQRRIPLTSAEFKKFGIKTAEEYSTFLFDLLHGIMPNTEILNRIVISGVMQFKRDDLMDRLETIISGDISNENYSLTNVIKIESYTEFDKIQRKLFGKDCWLTDIKMAKNSLLKTFISVGLTAAVIEGTLLFYTIMNVL